MTTTMLAPPIRITDATPPTAPTATAATEPAARGRDHEPEPTAATRTAPSFFGLVEVPVRPRVVTLWVATFSASPRPASHQPVARRTPQRARGRRPGQHQRR